MIPEADRTPATNRSLGHHGLAIQANRPLENELSEDTSMTRETLDNKEIQGRLMRVIFFRTLDIEPRHITTYVMKVQTTRDHKLTVMMNRAAQIRTDLQREMFASKEMQDIVGVPFHCAPPPY
jgi:hypothetical protein